MTRADASCLDGPALRFQERPMPIPLTCDCGKSLRAPDGLAGKKVRCPACNAVLPVPLPAKKKRQDEEIDEEDAENRSEGRRSARKAPTRPEIDEADAENPPEDEPDSDIR